MPKLPMIDFNIIDIEALFRGGHHVHAVRRAQKLLREGYWSPPFLELVAKLLDPPPKKSGRGRRAAAYYRWLEVGDEFYRMQETMSVAKAYTELAKSEAASLSTIRRAVEYYDRAMEEVARIDREESGDQMEARVRIEN